MHPAEKKCLFIYYYYYYCYYYYYYIAIIYWETDQCYEELSLVQELTLNK